MTGHKGNSEFCLPETLNVPRGEAEGNIEVEGKQNSLLHTLAALAKLSGCQNQPVLSKNHDNSLFLCS